MVTTATILIILGVILFGGLIKGFTGFGYAIASTAILALLFDPALAVVVVILPTLAANLSLVGELNRADISSCIARFWPFVLSATLGTVLGMFLLDVIPQQPLRGALGLFTLGYVVVRQPWFELPGGGRFTTWCFKTSTIAKVGWGFISGFIFGVANIGVQIVAYLDHLSLSRSTFVGVLAMILVGISSIRVGLAWILGLYGAESILLISVLAVMPGLLGVLIGRRVRHRVESSTQVLVVLLVLLAIGLRLTLSGAFGV